MQKRLNNLPHNIRFLRKSKGLSQTDLADHLGINRSNIAAYESKNVEPRLSLIIDIADYFNISLRSLIEEPLSEDNPPELLNNNPDPVDDIEVDEQYMDLQYLNAFIRKSNRVKKILDGFKAFYTYKKSSIGEGLTFLSS